MMITLRPYQEKLEIDIYAAWEQCRNVLAVSPTGSGKTAVKGKIFKTKNQPSVAIAHRQELVSQISMALAQFGIHHRIIAPEPVIRFCITQQVRNLGSHFHHPNAPAAVAGVDTLVRRGEELAQWMNQVLLCDIDEAHHCLPTNKWGKAISMFPNANVLGLTATPVRCDKKSLGRQTGGIFDTMVVGPGMRDLITQGFLADYKIYGPPSSLDEAHLKVGSTGDFTSASVQKEVEQSTITGDVVDHYFKLAPGKRGITFTVSVKHAGELAAAFRQHGLPAEAVNAKTPDNIRQQILERFARGEILQLINVDLFGEGMDVPAVEVVSAARPTMSYGLYIQQFGRALRPAPGKTHGIYIDHVSNVVRHNLPDLERNWILDDFDKGRRAKKTTGEIPITTCKACFQPFPRLTKECPHCGHIEEPEERSDPDFVDGDLLEFSPELLQQLRDEANRNFRLMQEKPTNVREAAIKKNMQINYEVQQDLRTCIAYWAGIQKDVYHRPDSESYRLFYHTFGLDVLNAQSLKTDEARALTATIREAWI